MYDICIVVSTHLFLNQYFIVMAMSFCKLLSMYLWYILVRSVRIASFVKIVYIQVCSQEIWFPSTHGRVASHTVIVSFLSLFLSNEDNKG